MKKHALFLSLVIFGSILLFSCTDDIKPDVTGGSGTTPTTPTTSASVIGKWKLTGMTTNLDSKTYTATVSQIIAGLVQDSIQAKAEGKGGLVIDPSGISYILTQGYNFEFKADSTFSTPAGSGKWTVSADKTTLSITANNKTSKFTLSKNTSGELQLGLQKFTRTTASAQFTPSTALYFFDALFGLYGVYGPTPPTEVEANTMLSYQGFLNYTKQ